MTRLLRWSNVAVVVSVALFAATSMLWVRSYWHGDVIAHKPMKDTIPLGFDWRFRSICAHMDCVWINQSFGEWPARRWTYENLSPTEHPYFFTTEGTAKFLTYRFLGFGFGRITFHHWVRSEVLVPDWFIAACFAVCHSSSPARRYAEPAE